MAMGIIQFYIVFFYSTYLWGFDNVGRVAWLMALVENTMAKSAPVQ